MRAKLFLLSLTAMVLLGISACSPSVGEEGINISCDDFMTNNHLSQAVEIQQGETMMVTLCSNPTTGFQWEEAQISNTAVLSEIEHRFIGPESSLSQPLGTPGQEVWIFQALQKGTSTTIFHYSRPWEGGEKSAWTFTLTVTVK